MPDAAAAASPKQPLTSSFHTDTVRCGVVVAARSPSDFDGVTQKVTQQVGSAIAANVSLTLALTLGSRIPHPCGAPELVTSTSHPGSAVCHRE